jgi:Fe-S cluster assembly iron-binding protein IscA
MLTVTENARAIVKEITASSPSEVTALRISVEGAPESAPSFAMSAVAAAEPGDQTLEEGGATIHLDPNAAQQLDDKVLDAAVDQAGGVQFSIAPQV